MPRALILNDINESFHERCSELDPVWMYIIRSVAQFILISVSIPTVPACIRKQFGPGGSRVQDGERGIRSG